MRRFVIKYRSNRWYADIHMKDGTLIEMNGNGQLTDAISAMQSLGL